MLLNYLQENRKMIDNIGHVLKAIRLVKGLRLRDVCTKKTGIFRNTITNHETGKVTPSLPALIRYSMIYDVSVSDMVYLAEHYSQIACDINPPTKNDALHKKILHQIKALI